MACSHRSHHFQPYTRTYARAYARTRARQIRDEHKTRKYEYVRMCHTSGFSMRYVGMRIFSKHTETVRHAETAKLNHVPFLLPVAARFVPADLPQDKETPCHSRTEASATTFRCACPLKSSMKSIAKLSAKASLGLTTSLKCLPHSTASLCRPTSTALTRNDSPSSQTRNGAYTHKKMIPLAGTRGGSKTWVREVWRQNGPAEPR